MSKLILVEDRDEDKYQRLIDEDYFDEDDYKLISDNPKLGTKKGIDLIITYIDDELENANYHSLNYATKLKDFILSSGGSKQLVADVLLKIAEDGCFID